MHNIKFTDENKFFQSYRYPIVILVQKNAIVLNLNLLRVMRDASLQ